MDLAIVSLLKAHADFKSAILNNDMLNILLYYD